MTQWQRNVTVATTRTAWRISSTQLYCVTSNDGWQKHLTLHYVQSSPLNLLFYFYTYSWMQAHVRTWPNGAADRILFSFFWSKVRNENSVRIYCVGNNDSGNNFKLISAKINVEYLLFQMAVVVGKKAWPKRRKKYWPLIKAGLWSDEDAIQAHLQQQQIQSSANEKNRQNTNWFCLWAWSMAKGNS